MPSLPPSWAIWEKIITSVYFLTNLHPSLIYKCQITVHTNKRPFLGTPALEMRGTQRICYNTLCPAHWVLWELRDLGWEQAAWWPGQGAWPPPLRASPASRAKWGEWEHPPRRCARLNKWGHAESLYQWLARTHIHDCCSFFFFKQNEIILNCILKPVVLIQ